MNRPRTAILVLFALAVAGMATAQTPAPAEKRDFVVAFNAVDINFDPHHSIYASEAQLFTAIYEGLFTYDPSSLEPIKAACSDWNVSKDDLTYTFTIRDDAKWSDGTPLLAADFRNAWLRALAPAEKADYASFFDVIEGAKAFRLGKSVDPSTVGISTEGDRTLVVKLASPAAYFTRLLCHHAFSPIHPSMLGVHDWSTVANIPVDGPFTIASRSKDEIVLAKNPQYWDAANVPLPGIRVMLTDDDDKVTRLFDNGGIDWLAGPMNLDKLLSRDAIHAGAMFGTQYWYFDCGTAPFDSPDLREALALLLPWKDIRSTDSYLNPAETLVLPLAGYTEAKGISATDEAKAMDLLAKSGHAGGAGVPTISIAIPSGADDAVRVSGLMKSAWEKAGLKVEVTTIPAAGYFDAVRQKTGSSPYTLALTTWIGDFADPLAFLQMWESDSNLNDAKYHDPEYDSLLAASSSLEGEKRFSALAKAETRLLTGAACLPLHYSIALNVIDTDTIGGWHENALDIHPFKSISIGEARIRPGVVLAPSTMERGS
ncbi:MAG TPA: peptide ABC transporter substrate-binding protein [Rectinemataceae bacterium]|nr:peptide ABC transporter substrate-binding protein [Rectinemataceae bacterium]